MEPAKEVEQEKIQLLKELNAVKLSLSQAKLEAARYRELSSRSQGNLEPGKKPGGQD